MLLIHSIVPENIILELGNILETNNFVIDWPFYYMPQWVADP